MSEIALVHAQPATDSDEPSLLSRARSGDAAAVDVLVRRYLRDVYQTAFQVLGDRDLAQDAAQDAFVNAIGALHQFRGDASFRTWLMRIALNAARSVGRRRGRRREVAVEAAHTVAADRTDEVARIANEQTVGRVQALLPRLPEKQRMAVVLRLQQGLSYAEVAETLDCSEGAARVNYHLGLKKLREWMTQ